MKIKMDLVSREDGSLIDVVEVDETLYRQAQVIASYYGLTLLQCLECWLRALNALSQAELTDYLTNLLMNSRVQSDTCFWTGSGQNDPIYPYFFRQGDGYQ